MFLVKPDKRLISARSLKRKSPVAKKTTMATKRKRQEPEEQGLIRLQVYCIILWQNAHFSRSLGRK